MSEQAELEYHVEIWVQGPVEDLDRHLKWVEETATLAERPVAVKTATRSIPEHTEVARFSVHFHAEQPIDAVLMAMGLCKPQRDSPLEVVEVRAARHR